MEGSRRISRRTLLTGLGGFAVGTATAGCLDGGSEDANGDDETPDDSTDEGDGETDDQAGDRPDSGTGTLDLREANVVEVAFEGQNGSYRFDVTLHHDDDGEEGYANWWQVERPDGTRLGRRELLHAHSNQPFTRSETIEIPGDATCVVVRGHDQTHGYGGVAMLVSLDSGETSTVDQGAERRSVDESECP